MSEDSDNKSTSSPVLKAVHELDVNSAVAVAGHPSTP